MVWFKCGQLNLLDYVVYHDINHASEYHDKKKTNWMVKLLLYEYLTQHYMLWHDIVEYHIISYHIVSRRAILYDIECIMYRIDNFNCTAIGYVILYLEH